MTEYYFSSIHSSAFRTAQRILKWFHMLTDLVPRDNLEAWLKYLRKSLPAVPFKASTQLQSRRLGRRKLKKASASDKKITDELSIENKELQGSKCFGAELVMSLLANYCRNKGIKTSISVGVVGKCNKLAI